MSVFDKLAFWKKEEPIEDPLKQQDFGPELGMQRNVGLGSDNFGMNQDPLGPTAERSDVGSPSAFQELEQHHMPPPVPNQPISMQKDLEILSAKVDALRAAIESMNQRIINIENIAKAEQDKHQRVRW